MIKVHEINDGVFHVRMTDPDLEIIGIASDRNSIPCDQLLQGLLTFVLGVYRKVLIQERNRDGLD